MKITVCCQKCGTETETELVPMKTPGFYYYEVVCRSCGGELKSVLKDLFPDFSKSFCLFVPAEAQQGAGE